MAAYLVMLAVFVALGVSVALPDVGVVVLVAVVLAVLGLRSRPDEQTLFSWLIVITFLIPQSLIIKPLGQVGQPVLLVAGLCMLFWVFGRCDLRLGLDLGRQPIRFVVLLYVLATLCAYIAGQVRGMSPLEASGADAAMLSLPCFCGILLFVVDGVRTVEGVIKIMKLLVAGAVTLVITAFLQYFSVADLYRTMRLPGLTFHDTEDVDALHRSGFYRVQGLAGHPIEYGVIVGMVLPIALHLALHIDRPRKDRWWLATALLAIGLPLAVSRSGVLTAIVSLTIYLVSVNIRWVLNMLPLAVGGLLALGAAFPGLLGSIRSLFFVSNLQSDPSIAGRTDDLPAVLATWAEHPFFGIGPGTYIPKLYRILDNEYLYTLATMGALGVLALLSIFVVGYLLARRVQRVAVDPKVRGMGQALAASIAGAAVASFTFDAFGYKIMFVTTLTIVACTGALWRLAVRDQETARVHIGSTALHRPTGQERRPVPSRGAGLPAGADLQ
ncbi:O-antigen ligase family protein [Planotetraspora silvatica]|uniref:O-antigen ligase family protein n=1 Tax=Planotetraspora silvatica TaxID=234614 RepID=UPI0019529AD7|nr:O-antigen ligase family protein [Planotetraspora silvatica]